MRFLIPKGIRNDKTIKETIRRGLMVTEYSSGNYMPRQINYYGCHSEPRRGEESHYFTNFFPFLM